MRNNVTQRVAIVLQRVTKVPDETGGQIHGGDERTGIDGAE
jgi:hypothetical protein